jgi:GT2 family glycosyltransferase
MTRTTSTVDVVELELADPLPDIVHDALEEPIKPRPLLVRLHDHPVGVLKLRTGPGGISARELAAEIWRVCAEDIRQHLRADGIEAPARLAASGLPPGHEPRCATRRRRLLSGAPAISVMIATRDRTESLVRCIDSVMRLAYPRFDIVVVDSAPSTSDTSLAVDELRARPGLPTIHYVRAELPGLGYAHNRGLDAVTGRWVAITDDDVTVDRDWLTGILEGASSNTDVACVTGPILAAEIETQAQELLEQYGGYSRGFTHRCYNTGELRPPDPLFPFTVGRLGSGANMAFLTSFLRHSGGFDPATGVGTPARAGDDLLAFFRVLVSGHTLAYQPSALLWHWHPRDYGRLFRVATGYGIGAGAYLTSAIAHDPSLIRPMARSVVPGARHFLSRSSEKNVAKQTNFPRSLELAELTGLMCGPFAYARSYLRYRRSQ